MVYQKIKYDTKWLVVDTNILRSAGLGENPQSLFSNELLIAILEICHNVVTNSIAEEETSYHAGRIAISWKKDMEIRRKLNRNGLGNKFSKALDTNKHLISNTDFREIEKDAFLYDLALSKDKIIISRETNSADRIKKYSFLKEKLIDTQYIVLSDSEPDFHSLIQWLQANCPPTDYYYFR